MSDKILYYPSISLPSNEWSIQSILYWDKVAVIVPDEYMKKPDLIGKRMLTLINASFVERVNTVEFMSEQYSISNTIIHAIMNENVDLEARQNNFLEGNAHLIHQQKFSDELFAELLAMKLASRMQEPMYNWYLVETKTASIMMTYLASAISRRIGYTAATDDPEYIIEIDQAAIVENDISRIRSHILENVMPFPMKPDFKKLMNFKERYYDQLLDYRRYIERICIVIAALPNEEYKRRLLEREIQTINDRKAELMGILNENKLGKIVLGAFKGMIVDVIIALITGDPVTPAATILGGVNEVIKSYKGNPIKDEDLAYIALIDNRLR